MILVTSGCLEKTSAVVPNVIGLSLEEAKKKISDDKDAQIGLDIREQYNNTAAKGVVIFQNPIPGASVPFRSNISLVISRGRPVVPNLVGKNKEQAKQLVEEVQLIFSSCEEYNDNVPKGKIISQKSSPNDAVPVGSVVEVLISKGPEPTFFGG